MTCHHPEPKPPCFTPQPLPHSPPQPLPRSPPQPPPVLQKCHIEAHIVDVHSFVTVSQEFHNPATVGTNALRYNFSVLAGSAVCGFEMVRASGKKVIGVIKEKELAQQELKAAIAAGHTHAHGEELTEDVFSISVGNIGPNETVTVNLSYISPLIDDDSKYRDRDALKPQLRFTVPRAYMQRAGQAPTGQLLSGVTHTNVSFTMKLSIEQATKIIDYRTPGYSPAAVWGPAGASNGSSDEEGERFLTLTFPSSTSSNDVVVVITADKIGDSRVFIESHPSHNPPTAALALTLVPASKFYESTTDMEYIVVVDRSSSMEGLKLDMTKTALHYLLGQLPQRGSSFNIFSYGESVKAMWTEARAYDDIEVDRAKSYITAMTANFGANKQTSKALQYVFRSLPSTLARPVSIFLLTDGAAWDIKECIATTEAAIRTQSTPQNFMRVFTLGLGDGASTETCDGISRAGRGISTYIVTAEQSFLGKCVRLVLAARTPPITNFKIFWEKENRTQPSLAQQPSQITSSTQGQVGNSGQLSSVQPPQRIRIRAYANDGYEYVPPRDVGPLMRARQAPADITFLHGTRTSVFAIVPLSILTEESTLRVDFDLANSPMGLEPIPISRLDHSRGKTFLHTLAAKALITDLEDKHLTSPTVDTAELKQDIMRYGIKYGLTSRFTSFLAVDDNRPIGIANDVFGTTSVIPRRLAASERLPVRPEAAAFSAFTSFLAVHDNRPVGIANDAIGTASVIPGRLAASERLPFLPEAPSLSSRSTRDATENLREPDDPAILFELSGLQSCNGGFGLNAVKVIGLVQPFCPERTKQVVSSLEEEMVAALLAWLWMTLWCGIEAVGMTEKVNAWTRKNARSGLDVDTIQRNLYQIAN